jgi:GNAT superfamily N-acetyltransferase
MRETRNELMLSSEPGDQQLDAIHAFLTRSYWAEGISRDVVQRSIEHSLCFGVFHQGNQVAFARVVTDQATFAYLADVYVLEDYRRRGLSIWMLDAVMSDSRLQGVRRFTLATRDAHALYARYGFKAPEWPQTLMEIRRQGIYRAQAVAER